MHNRPKRAHGFTIIELLVVVAIIATLTAVLTVGGKKIRIAGKGLQQKAVFHAMTVGLEMFNSDFRDYPDSRIKANSAGTLITGAQHLAEALLGRDGRGFEPRTRWLPPDDGVHNPAKPTDLLYDNTADSLARRKQPYCELKYGYAVSIYALWGGNNGGSQIYDSGANPTGAERSPVITDVFNKVEVTLPGGEIVRAGTPILYYKADASKLFRVDAARQPVADSFYDDMKDYSGWVYNFADNRPLVNLPWLGRAGEPWSGHFPDPDGGGKSRAQVFYERITQPGGDATRGFFKPYNGSTFLLISAGNDGIFGTKDDIVNFD